MVGHVLLCSMADILGLASVEIMYAGKGACRAAYMCHPMWGSESELHMHYTVVPAILALCLSSYSHCVVQVARHSTLISSQSDARQCDRKNVGDGMLLLLLKACKKLIAAGSSVL